MPTAYTEDPIPPYTVAIEQDGCLRGYIAMPQGWGSFDDCRMFIANHLPPHGYELAIYPTGTERLRSYVIPAPTIPRRIRLSVQDFIDA